MIPTWAFYGPVPVHRHVMGSSSTPKSTTTRMRLGASGNNNNQKDESTTPAAKKVNLVNQARYVNSIETLQREIAKIQGIEYTSPPPEQTPVYVLGRFEVPLRIDSAPGLDLTETEYLLAANDDDDSAATSLSSDDNDDENDTKGGLVLVTSVTGNAADAGLQAFDTIVAVSCPTTKSPPFYANVNSCDLPTTAQALQAAMKHALDNDLKEIHLEMNRLITGYYGAE
jgi:hypothetical protein